MANRDPEHKVLLRHFATYDTREEKLVLCEHYWRFASVLIETLKPGPELNVALRKLLESRDAALRCDGK